MPPCQVLIIGTLYFFPSNLTLLVLKLEYCGRLKSILWLSMLRLLVSPGHQQPWYSLSRTDEQLSSSSNDFDYWCHLSIEKWKKKFQTDFFLFPGRTWACPRFQQQIQAPVLTIKASMASSVVLSWMRAILRSFLQWTKQLVKNTHQAGIYFNSSSPRQNACQFAGNMFKCIFLNENFWISNYISLKCVP